MEIQIGHNSFKKKLSTKANNELKIYIYHILVMQLVLLLCFPANYFVLGIGISVNLLYLVYLYFC